MQSTEALPDERSEQTLAEDRTRITALLVNIVKALVDSPEQVDVQSRVVGKELHLAIQVAQSDLGQVIGHQGRIARALRTVLAGVGKRRKRRCLLTLPDQLLQPGAEIEDRELVP